MAEVQGTCVPSFQGVADALSSLIAQDRDVGASVCVMVDGEPVVDVWGGHLDEERTVPWERDTIINVWSTTKTMTNLCALVLADRGDIDVHAPVARYWPEFADAGKEAVEVRHLLSHTAGLPGWVEPMTEEDLYDWEKATELLARQAPLWEPGTAAGYHALTQGYLVGEVVRRVTGVSLGTFFAKEVAGPLGADFHIGVDPAHDGRVAQVIPPEPVPLPLEPDPVVSATLDNPRMRGEVSWSERWRRAEIPAANGHGNARSVAAVQAVLAGGGEVGGTRLLSEAGCQRVFEEQFQGTDLVLGLPVRYGIGYGLTSDLMPLSPNPRACFWGGWGGSLVLVDLDARMVVAYVMNRMGSGTTGDFRAAAVVMAAHQARRA